MKFIFSALFALVALSSLSACETAGMYGQTPHESRTAGEGEVIRKDTSSKGTHRYEETFRQAQKK